MPMTKEDWKKFELKLGYAYGMVELVCDGYQVTFSVQKSKGLQYEIMVYVDGWFKGTMVSEDCEIRRKFMRQLDKYLHPPKKRQQLRQLRKKLPKKHRERWMDPDATFTYFTPVWPSAQKLRRHLVKNCKSIEWGRSDAEILKARYTGDAEKETKVLQ